jgi:hypothetical protein
MELLLLHYAHGLLQADSPLKLDKGGATFAKRLFLETKKEKIRYYSF